MKPDDYNNFNLAARIDYGVKAGVQAAILGHKNSGKSIFVLQDSQIVEIPADQIQVSEPNPPAKE